MMLLCWCRHVLLSFTQFHVSVLSTWSHCSTGHDYNCRHDRLHDRRLPRTTRPTRATGRLSVCITTSAASARTLTGNSSSEDTRQTTFLLQRVSTALQRENVVFCSQNTIITEWSAVAAIYICLTPILTGFVLKGLYIRTNNNNNKKIYYYVYYYYYLSHSYSIYKIGLRLSVCQCVRLRALSRSHFLINFHQNWYRRKNPQKEERVR